MGGRPSGVDASGRPLSANPDAVRKRNARAGASKASTSVGGRGGGEPATKGNPLKPDSWSLMGEPLSPHEAERQLFYAHVGLAKVIGSTIDMEDLREEFGVAGENYAFVANKMWTPLRVVIRFVAPVVLVAVLLVIWGQMIASTPWVHSLRDWWSNRGNDDEVVQAPPAETPAPAAAPARQPVGPAQEPEQPRQTPPPIPRRMAVVRNLRGVRH